MIGIRRIVGAVLTATLGLALTAGSPAAAQAPRGAGTERPIGPSPVYSGLAHGNITMASNSVVTCQIQPCSESASNASPVVFVKTDPNAPGNTASSATLSLPAGAKVLAARLYWQLNPVSTSGVSGDASKANQVAIKVPGASTYTRLTADTYDWFDALGSGSPTVTAHAGVKDVTAMVTGAGAGSYTVADIQACSGMSSNAGGSNLGCWGGWSLVVAYENAADPLHYLQMWDGFMRIRGGSTPTSATIDLSGIKTVASRTPNVTMGITAGDGDANITGDYLEVGRNSSSLQRLDLPAPGGVVDNNAFSSRIDTVTATGTGSNITSRNPNPVNNMAYDARTIDITGKLPPGSTGMQVKIGTTGDALYPQVVWLVSDALEPDLQITKANDPPGNTDDNPPGYVLKGDQVTYTFDVANKHADGSTTDLDTATDVVLTDTLPTGVTYVAGSNPNCSAAGQMVTCQLKDLKPGESTKVVFKVTVGTSVPDGTKLDNSGGVDFKGKLTDRPQHRDSNTVRNTVTSPGYTLTKKVDKAEAVPGDTLTYTVTLANTGKVPVTGVTVQDTLPPNTTYQSATPSQGSASGTGPIDWTVGTLPVKGSATLTIKVTVGEGAIGQTLVNRAKVPTGPPPTIPPDAQCKDDPTAACATTTVPTPTYTVEKQADKQSANPGDTVKYTITVKNTGKVTAANLIVTDDLTKIVDDADYNNDATASPGSVSYTAPKLTWTGTLSAGASATITYTVKVKNPNPGDHKLINAVSSETPGGNCPPGSTDPKCTTTTPITGLLIEKTVDKPMANPGDTVKYTVTVKNTGQTKYTPATFTDDLTKVLDDADYNNDAVATPGSVDYQAPNLTWTGNLDIGATATVSYTVKVKNPNSGDHKLINAVSSETPGGNCPPGSTDPKCTTTTPVSGLLIKKTADKKTVVPGDTVQYTITVENTGQTNYAAATFTDDLTKVLDDANYNNDAVASPGAVTYAAPNLTWTGPLDIGATATITYTVTVKKPNPGDKHLVNVVTSDTPGNNCPPGSTDPNCSSETPGPELTIKKAADKQTANPGDTVKYTVTVTNTGRVDLVGTTVTDDLTGVLDDADYNGDASATPVAGAFTFTAPNLVWKGDLKIGQSTTLTYSVKVKNPITGDHQLRNAVHTDQPGTCPPGSDDPDCTTVTPLPGIAIEKQADKQSANPGDSVKYTVTVRNTGQTKLTAASYTDDLTKVLDDADYNNDAVASPGSMDYQAPNLTWTGDLDIGATATITYSVKVKSTGDHKLINVITSDTPGGNCPPGSTDPKCTTTTPVSGLAIEKQADKQSANPGDTVKYTITVKNTGQTKYTAASYTDDLAKVLDDADYNNDGTASPGSVTYAAPKLTWTGDLDIGATATITYTVKIKNPDTGDHKLTNVITSDTPGGNCPPGSTDPKCTTTTPVSGLMIKKTSDKQSAKPGDKVTYTVTVTNTGQTPHNATFTDDLTAVLDDASYNGDATASTGTPSYAAPKLTWTGALAPGASATVTYSVTVLAPPKGDGKLRNVVTSDTPGGNCPPGSTDPDCTTTTPVTTFEVVKTSDKKTVKPGEVVTYRVEARNTGQVPIAGARFTDDLSDVLDNATYNGDARASIGTVSYAAPKLTWTGDLPVGAVSVITYSVTARSKDGHLRNAVSTDTPGGNCPPGSKDPKCSTDTTVVPPPPPPPVAVTGFPGWPLTVLGMLLLLGGAGFVLVARRRRTP